MDAPPLLEAQSIHIWSIRLDDQDALDPLRWFLSPDEKQRADRFLFDRHRRRFVVGRVALRQILAAYINIEPERIAFDYSGLGKPRMRGNRPDRGLCFNFSNSHERALLALTHDVEVGVDIERIRTMANLEGLADRFFSKVEKDTILAALEPERTYSFFRCWTRKEAFLKAIGKGLTFPLRDVIVDLSARSPIRIVAINDASEVADAWWLASLEVEPAYVAAIACRRHENLICQFDWQAD